MKTRSSKLLALTSSLLLLALISLLLACGQASSSESSDASTSADSSATEASNDANDRSESASGNAVATKSLNNVTKGLANDAKDAVNKKASEIEKEKQEAEKARLLEELEKVQLKPKTEILEYSTKKAKPLSLVECSDSKVEVKSNEDIDLTKTGVKKVVYTLTLDGQEVQRTIDFKVLDTKAPQIDFVDREPKIDVGTEYDPVKNVNFVKDSVDGELSKVDSAPEAKGSKAGEEAFYDAGWYTVEGTVDTNTAGVYSIDVNAADVHGNTAHRTFDVTVVASEPEAAAAPATQSYVLNTNTGKFHHPGCRAVKQMKDSNRMDVDMTREEVISMGYQPCGICCP